MAVVFKKDFVIFPLLFMPRLNIFSALMYLPTAFLADLGIVAVVLYFVTQSGKDVKLPWPKFGVDLDEVKPPKASVWQLVGQVVGAVFMLAVTDFALYLFVRHSTIFFVNLNWADPRPLFTPGAGRTLSLIVIAMLAVSTIANIIKIFTRTRWADVVSNVLSLGLIGLLLGQPFDGLFAVTISEKALPAIKYSVRFTLLFVAMMITIELVKDLVRLGRRKFHPVAHS